MEIQRSNRLKPTDEGDEIPDCILFEVFLRLPLNSVFTCRIVSKRWLSVASGPYFIRAYVNFRASSSSRPPWIVLPPSVSGEEEKFLPKLVRNPSNHFILPELYLRPPRGRDIAGRCYIVGVSNGLVLYCSSTRIWEVDFFDFWVCNPITGHRVRSLKPVESKQWVPKPAWGFLTRVDGVFVLRSYRIVQAVRSVEKLTPVITFKVYYSEMGDWQKFTVPLREEHMLCLLELQESAAVVNGILHWADTTRGGVIAYDPEANPEQIRFIPAPRDVEYGVLRSCSCEAHRGELRYFVGYLSRDGLFPRFGIWRLEDYYGSGDRWRLEHKVVEESSVNIGIRIRPQIVCFDPLDSDVVYFMDMNSEYTFPYNLKSGVLLEDDWLEDNETIGAYSFMSCRLPRNLVLVFPPWPTHVAEKHLERLGGGPPVSADMSQHFQLNTNDWGKTNEGFQKPRITEESQVVLLIIQQWRDQVICLMKILCPVNLANARAVDVKSSGENSKILVVSYI